MEKADNRHPDYFVGNYVIKGTDDTDMSVKLFNTFRNLRFVEREADQELNTGAIKRNTRIKVGIALTMIADIETDDYSYCTDEDVAAALSISIEDARKILLFTYCGIAFPKGLNRFAQAECKK